MANLRSPSLSLPEVGLRPHKGSLLTERRSHEHARASR